MPIKFTGPKASFMASDTTDGYTRELGSQSPGTTVEDMLRGRVHLKGCSRQVLIVFIQRLIAYIRARENVKVYVAENNVAK